MNSLEERVLESVAWTDGSSLHDAIRLQQQHQRQQKEKSKSATGKSAGRVSDTGTSTGTAAASAAASAAVTLFFRKLSSVAASRVFNMCSQLQLSTGISSSSRGNAGTATNGAGVGADSGGGGAGGAQVSTTDRVWTAVKYVLDNKPVAAALLRGRHLDSVVLCSIYGVCKVCGVHVRTSVGGSGSGSSSRGEVTFRKVISSYTKLSKRENNAQVRAGANVHRPG